MIYLQINGCVELYRWENDASSSKPGRRLLEGPPLFLSTRWGVPQMVHKWLIPAVPHKAVAEVSE